MHRLPELRADLVELECDPREGLDSSDSDDDEVGIGIGGPPAFLVSH